MRKVVLEWFGPYAVCDLLNAFKIDDQKLSAYYSEEKFPALREKGLYIYLRNDLSSDIYVGKSEQKGSALRKRIRHEMLHERYATLDRRMKEKDIDKLDLIVKVAHIKGIDPPEEVIPLTTLESAIIFETHPEIPDQTRNLFRPTSIQIHNTGCFDPLPQIITKIKGDKY